MAYPSDLVRTKNWGTEILTDSDLEGQYDLIINWVMALANASTGHAHDGTSNQGPKLSYSGVTTTFGNGFTTVTGASGDYLLIASDVSDSNTTKKCLASDYIFVPSATNALSGSVIQMVNSQDGAVATGTTTVSFDDSIPQNTEGTQFLSKAITPSNASNLLKIDVVFEYGTSAGTVLILALFQDSTANALASVVDYNGANNQGNTVKLTHWMTAGTTSATTFKVRAGMDSAATVTFNGASGARKLGGVMASSITITEIKA